MNATHMPEPGIIPSSNEVPPAAEVLNDDRNLVGKELQKLVNQMTNWQRTKWARTGYPKSRKWLQYFIDMKRPQR